MVAQIDAILKSLRKMRCVVVAPAGKARDELCGQLKHSMASVATLWPAPTTIGPECDIVILSVAGLQSDSPLFRVPRTRQCFIGLVEEAGPSAMKGIVDLGFHALVTYPTNPMLSIMAVVHGVSVASYENRLRTKVAKLEGTLRAAHTVERAVRILAQTLHMGDDQAYQHLRAKAMDRRESMHELAAQVLNAHAVLDDMSAGRSQGQDLPGRLRVVGSSEREEER